MATIYVVQGYSGSYDDFRTWLVKAFTNEAAAQRFAERLRRRVLRLVRLIDGYREADPSWPLTPSRFLDEWGDPKPDTLDPSRVWDVVDYPNYEAVAIELCQ